MPGAAADAAAQLVKLRQAEAFGVLDHHDRRRWHVYADLDHGGGDEKLILPFEKRSMARSLSAPFI